MGDSDMTVANAKVAVPRLVNQYLRGLDEPAVLNYLNTHAPDVSLSGNPRRPAKERGRHYYTIQARPDLVKAAADQLKGWFAQLEATAAQTVMNLELYEDHILDCHEAELSSLANKCGVWFERGQIGTGSGTGCLMYSRITGGPTIEVLFGDIAQQRVDILVNAANSQLLHSGGVARAIEKVAKVQQECTDHVGAEGPVPEGTCWNGSSGALKTVQSILHAVGPQWVPGCDLNVTRALLEKTMRSVFAEAEQEGARSIAIPLISCSIFNQLGPQNETNIMRIICETVKQSLDADSSLQVVRFVEIDKTRVKNFVDMASSVWGPSNTSLQDPDAALARTALVTQHPEYLFSWQDDDRKFKYYGGTTTDPAHYTLSEALSNGESSTILVVDSTKYTAGMRYTITFGSNKKGTQLNQRTGYTRPIEWKRNPDYVPVPVVPVPSSPSDASSSLVTVPLTIKYIGNVDIAGLKAKFTELIRKFTTQSDRVEGLGHEALRNIAQKHHLKLLIGEDGYCTLQGEEDSINAAYRTDIAQEMQRAQAKRPKEWDSQNGRVKLSPSDPEWKEVEAEFLASFAKHKATVTNVERIQVMSLYQQYHAQDHHIRNELGGLDPLHLSLFHGTGNSDPDLILSNPNGFNRGYANCGMWGRGTYFAERSDYSHDYAYKVDGTQRQMFLVDVIVGDFHEMPSTKVTREFRDPPQREDNSYYHSVKGFTNGSNVYITYSDNRQYPKYLITYRI